MNFLYKRVNLFRHLTSFCLNSTKQLNFKPIETENKIQIGSRLSQVLEKHRQTSILNEAIKSRPNKTNSRLLISASLKSKNHYAGQTYSNFSDQHNLVSNNWHNRISNGKHFTIIPNGAHPSLISKSHMEFSDLNLCDELIQSLNSNFKIKKPTNIQCLAIDEFKKRQSHLIINAETGGGKTLAYLLPIIENCNKFKSLIESLNMKRELNQPLAIILMPTRELVAQANNVIQKLISSIETDSFKTINVVCDSVNNQEAALNSNPIDILITQPSQLKRRLEQNQKHYESIYLKNVIIDEADTLLDDSFSEITLSCLNMLNLNLELECSQEQKLDLSCQLAFVSATVPRDLANILKDLIDVNSEKTKHLTTNRTNRLLLTTPQKFFRLSNPKRNEHLIELLRKELANTARKRITMIFSHRTTTAVFLSKFLKENNIECELLTKNSPQRESITKRFFNKEIPILVCTDIASRGWDTTHVSHVVNFEMPLFIADYLHRIGRVGRLGSVDGGIITNYVTKAYEADLVKNIERSIRLNQDLHNINANIKRFYNYKYTSKK